MDYKRRFFQLIAVSMLIFVLYALYNKTQVQKNSETDIEFSSDTKMYNVLMWTHSHTEPFVFMKLGRESFLEAKCAYNNCYVTNDRNYMEVSEWDAIMFHAPEYTWAGNPWHHGTPSLRTHKQIYIFVSIESSANYPVLDSKWDGYFNWTMTYRLDSDVPWLYLNVRDRQGKVIGPAENVHWIQNMESISDELLAGLKKKTKAVAWFVSNCRTLSKREKYAQDLDRRLQEYRLKLDVYGKCGSLKCPKRNESLCWEYLKEDYRFYLSFENSLSEDYVTEKLLQAMENNVVPIVLGKGDYSRFAPPNSYIDALKYSPHQLAELIHNSTNNITQYSAYFKWKDYYEYQRSYDSGETNPFCKLCEALNEKKSVKKVYENFRNWWNK